MLKLPNQFAQPVSLFKVHVVPKGIQPMVLHAIQLVLIQENAYSPSFRKLSCYAPISGMDVFDRQVSIVDIGLEVLWTR
jgi:hypothetical protein